MKEIENSQFDDNLFRENQVVFINVDRAKLACKNIRMNERIFRGVNTDDVFGYSKI